jgi:hypothetical protein
MSLIESDDDGGTGLQSNITRQLTAGTYIVAVSPFSTGSVGIPLYFLAVTANPLGSLTATGIPDQYEPDNTIADARAINLNIAETHSLHTVTDVDYLQFTTNAEGYVYIGVMNPLYSGIFTWAGLIVYDSDNNVVTSNGAVGFEPAIHLLNLAPDTYYIAVTNIDYLTHGHLTVRVTSDLASVGGGGGDIEYIDYPYTPRRGQGCAMGSGGSLSGLFPIIAVLMSMVAARFARRRN